MIGNLWEWTADWYAGLGASGENHSWTRDTFAGDGTWNIASSVHDGTAWQAGLPAAALRGGDWENGSQAGRFALSLDNAPSYRRSTVGLRCVLAR